MTYDSTSGDLRMNTMEQHERDGQLAMGPLRVTRRWFTAGLLVGVVLPQWALADPTDPEVDVKKPKSGGSGKNSSDEANKRALRPPGRRSPQG